MRIMATWTELPLFVFGTQFAALGIVMLSCSRDPLTGCRINIETAELLATLETPGPTTP